MIVPLNQQPIYRCHNLPIEFQRLCYFFRFFWRFMFGVSGSGVGVGSSIGLMGFRPLRRGLGLNPGFGLPVRLFFFLDGIVFLCLLNERPNGDIAARSVA